MRDQMNHLHPLRAISPVVVTDSTPVVSQIIDVQGFGALTFVLATGAVADADATFGVLVEHGNAADLSDAAAVPDDELIGTEAEAGFRFDDDNETRKIGYGGGKRYIRLTITPVGNSGNAAIAVVAILGLPHLGPTPNPPV